MGKITVKQEKFCLKYAETGNASEAYKQSYNCNRMKPETINRCAFDLVNNPKITARINELQKENERISFVKRNDILSRLKEHFYFDVRKILTTDNGNVTFKPPEQWEDDVAMNVEGVEIGKDGTLRIKIVGKEYTINRICAMCGYDAPARHNLNINDMTDDEIERLVNAITQMN